MATKGVKVEWSQVNFSQPYEIKHLAEKLCVSSQAITEAKRLSVPVTGKILRLISKAKRKADQKRLVRHELMFQVKDQAIVHGLRPVP